MTEAEPAAPPPEPPPVSGTPLALEFQGSAREYFRIWVVNLCLTLVTLGLFSAWAKVRKKRYFYSHTVLDGTPFQYLGQPVPILKGRVIAVLVFLLYYLSDTFFTATLPYVLAAGVLLAPWVIVRSAAFNARYSAFRNMTFHFDASYGQAVRTLYWLGIIPLLVAGSVFDWWGDLRLMAGAYAIAGLLFPWWIRRLKHFLVGHTRFGNVPGELHATGRQFFRIYFLSGLILVAAGVVTTAMFGSLRGSTDKFDAYMFYLLSAPLYIGYVLAFAYVQAHSGNLVWNQTRLGPLRFQSTLTGPGLARLYITNALAILGSLGLLTPWAVIRTLRYRIDRLHAVREAGLTEFHGGERATVRAAGAEVGELFDVDLSL